MVEFGTVRFRAGGHVGEYPVAAGFFECVLLQVGGLVAGADARVAVCHACHVCHGTITRQSAHLMER